MPNLLLVMLGGAAGAGLRYEVGRVALARLGPGFPWGTLAVNLLGGFTTFSAFSFDLFVMIGHGRNGIAFAYAAGSVVGSLVLLYVGFYIARAAI